MEGASNEQFLEEVPIIHQL